MACLGLETPKGESKQTVTLHLGLLMAGGSRRQGKMLGWDRDEQEGIGVSSFIRP